MRNETTVSKWGDGLALRIPQGLANEARITDGDSFALELQPDGSIVLRAARPRFELAELVAGVTPENQHGETDWGKREGKESW